MTASALRSPTRRAAGAALAFALMLALAGCNERREAKTGEAASELAALDLNGAPVRLEDYKGKVVLLNFWLGGCGPCLAEMPKLDAYYRDNRARGFEILALNMGQPETAVAKIARRLQVAFPLLADSLKITTDRYNVIAAPTSFVIDREGRLVAKVMGPFDEAMLEEKIGGLL